MATKGQQEKFPVFKKRLVFEDKFQMQRVRVSLINAIFNKDLANREIDYLAYYLALSGDIVDLAGRFSATATNIVKNQMGVSAQRMTNIKKALKKKNLIIEVDGKEEIIPELHPKSQEGAGFIIGLQVDIRPAEDKGL